MCLNYRQIMKYISHCLYDISRLHDVRVMFIRLQNLPGSYSYMACAQNTHIMRYEAERTAQYHFIRKYDP